MDMWKFYDVTHREHVFCNPTSAEKLGHLVEQLRRRDRLAEDHLPALGLDRGYHRVHKAADATRGES